MKTWTWKQFRKNFAKTLEETGASPEAVYLAGYIDYEGPEIQTIFRVYTMLTEDIAPDHEELQEVIEEGLYIIGDGILDFSNQGEVDKKTIQAIESSIRKNFGKKGA
jgi:hypothetical protein